MTKPLDDLDFTPLFGPAPTPAPDPDPFGRIGPGDPAWEAARGAWMQGAPLGQLFGDRVFDLNDTVGSDQANQRGDVFRLQALLHREGVLDAMATGGPTGYWSRGSETALRDFQKQNGLTVDGWAGPGGETMTALRRQYASAAPDAATDWLAAPEAAAQDAPPADRGLDDARRTETIRGINRDLARLLGLDPQTMTLDSPDVTRALSAARFYHLLDRQGQYRAMQDIERLQRDDPALMGALRGKVAASIANPLWEIPMMTPERLRQAKRETEQTLQVVRVLEGIGDGGKEAWKYGKPKGAPGAIKYGLKAFGYGMGRVREGFEKALRDIETEEKRRGGGF